MYKLFLLSLSIIVTFSSSATIISAQNNDKIQWPSRPAGKNFRIWIKPVKVSVQRPMIGEVTETHAIVIWQTGKALPVCGANGFVVENMYDVENGKKVTGGFVGFSGNGGFVHTPRAQGLGSDMPCFLSEDNAPALIQPQGGPGRTIKNKLLLQSLQPVIKFSPRGKPLIKWVGSQVIDIDGETIGNETKCFGPAPCPIEIPEYVAPVF